MVDVKFISRAAHFVPYPLLREIAAGRVTQSAGIEYIGEEGVRAIEGNFNVVTGWSWLQQILCHTEMALVHRGRLSVQRVQAGAWDAVEQLAEKGGWNEVIEKRGGSRKRKRRE